MMKKILLVIFLLLLSSPVFCTDWTQDANAVSTYLLNEASGDALDSTGSNDGTLDGATQGVAGVFDDAYSFDGNDNVNFGTSVNFDLTTGTLMFHLYLDSQPGSTSDWGFLSKDDGGANVGDGNFSMGYYTTDNKMNFALGNSTSPYNYVCASNSALSATTWYHVAGVFGGVSGMILYIDGVAQTDTDAHQGGLNRAAAVMFVGALRDGLWEFQGDIDEVGIFNDRKDSTDIDDIMCNGLVQAGTTFTPSVMMF